MNDPRANKNCISCNGTGQVFYRSGPDDVDKDVCDCVLEAYETEKKTINSNGTCRKCETKSIHYGIKSGSFTYYCTYCDKIIKKEDIFTPHDIRLQGVDLKRKLKERQLNRMYNNINSIETN